MDSYLRNKVGERLGVIRAGMPKEVYFEAVLRSVEDGVAVFEDNEGREIAVPVDKIMAAGAPESMDEDEKNKPGFF